MSIQSLHLTVATICEQNGRFLMVEEQASNRDGTVINQPAGHIEPGESIIEAVIRETLEETAYDFTPTAIVGIYQLSTDSGKTYFRVCFCGEVTKHPKAYQIDNDILAVHWLDASAIKTHPSPRSALVMQCLDDYLSGQRYSLDILNTLN